MAAGPDFDVIVIGGGGAGMSAALMAAEAGANVLIVEAAASLGGATALSGGCFYASNTRVQKEAGVEDKPAAMYAYGMALNRYRMEPSVFRRFCEETAGALHWLMDIGVEFRADMLNANDVSGVPRCHWAAGRGASIAQALEGRLEPAGVQIATNTRVRRLVVENGAVAGIEVDGEVFRSNAVVVSSGGFGANDELLSKHYPSADTEGHWYIGPPTNQGDSILFGEAAGADFTGANRGLQLMSPGLARTLEMPPAWIVLVNRLGRRFMDESVPYCVHNSAMEGQPDRKAFAIFDHQTFANPPRSANPSSDWNPDILARALGEGRIETGATLEDLARTLGIRPGNLTQTVAAYNTDVAGGADTGFFKPTAHLRAIGEGPYYAATMTMQILCLTSYGLRIDRDARVQDPRGKPIPGLYAAGEAAGGLMGEVYIGSGNSVANAVTMGRIAGANAGRYARSNFGEA